MKATDLNYEVCLSRLPPANRGLYFQEAPDAGLERYLETCRVRRAGRMRTLLQRVLRAYLSDYDANGLLDMYSMHLLSTPQAARLLDGPRGGRLLDIGAGSGDVTAELAPLFDEVFTTEVSHAMARRLRRRGFRCIRGDIVQSGFPHGSFDVVTLLNVLDRCIHPVELLRRCVEAMGNGTRLVVSLPLPYRPHAYSGAQTIDPVMPLPIQGESWEEGALNFMSGVLAPQGLKVCRFTRVPYLSAGDSENPLYVLDAFVACCRKAAPTE